MSLSTTLRPIELYHGFDEHFFRSDGRKEAASRYRKLLDQYGTFINHLFNDPTKVMENIAIYDQLSELEKFEYVHSEVIEESSEGLEITLDDLTRKSGVSLTDSQKKYCAGRVQAHLARLMFPEEYAKRWSSLVGISKRPQNSHGETFATDLLRYIATTPEKTERKFRENTAADKFEKFVGSEGQHVFLFWTLAPYVYQNLKERGLAPIDSIRTVVEWAQSSYDPQRPFHDYLLNYGHLAEKWITNPLGYDERMPTHLKIRLLSRRVVKELRP